MGHKRFIVIAMFLSALFITAPAGAEDAIPPLTIKEASVAAYDELTVFYNISGTRETLRQEGKKFLSISATFEPPWSESVKKLKLDWKEITLSDGSTTMPMIGFTRYYGVNKLGANSLSKSRPGSWKKKSTPVPYNAIFLVPANSQSLRLTIGPSSWDIQVPQTPATPPDPAELVTVEIVSARMIDSIESSRRAGDLKPRPKTRLRNLFGNILEVTIIVKPERTNTNRPGNFYWSSDWVGAVDDKGQVLSQLGQKVGKKIGRSASNSINRFSDKPWPSKPVTLYFSAPDNLKSFDLIYTWSKVASGKVDKPASLFSGSKVKQ